MASQEIFEHEGKTYKVRLPNSKEREEGERIFSRTFNKAIQDGCLLEGQVMTMARKHGLWDDEKEARLEALRKELEEKQHILDEGGIELEEAKKIALDMRTVRYQVFIYNMMLNELKGESANRKADDARINYFVSQCIVTQDGKKVYKDVDDFYMSQNEDLAQLAISYFSRLWYNFNEETFAFPEDVFLKEYGLEEEVQSKKKEKKPFLKNGKPVKPKEVKA